MLVYLEETSSVTIKVPGSSGGNLLSLFMESVVSQIYDGRRSLVVAENNPQNAKCFPSGHHSKTQLVYLDYHAGLWILGKRYESSLSLVGHCIVFLSTCPLIELVKLFISNEYQRVGSASSF